MNILFATTNEGKLKEAKNILKHNAYHIISPAEVNNLPKHVEETGSTMEENAQLKAKIYGDVSGFPTLADDTGLIVDILNGRPGVRSARYADNDQARIAKLLLELKNVPLKRRTAQFVTAICLYDPNTKLSIVTTGTITGRINTNPIGSGGFGYDPIFYSDELGKTFAQASLAEKNHLSHRARALRDMKPHLESLVNNKSL